MQIRLSPGIRLGAIALLLTSLALPSAASEPPNSGADIVNSFVAAYNDHNIDLMLEHCVDDVRWLTVTGDAVYVEANGKAALRSAMKSHFENSPATRSSLLAIESDGPMVIAIEKAMANAGDTSKAQCAASVYQLENGLIRNVWYFDAYACGG